MLYLGFRNIFQETSHSTVFLPLLMILSQTLIFSKEIINVSLNFIRFLDCTIGLKKNSYAIMLLLTGPVKFNYCNNFQIAKLHSLKMCTLLKIKKYSH